MPRRLKLIDENPAQPVVGELDLGLPSAKKLKFIEVEIRKQIWGATKDDPSIKLFANPCGVAYQKGSGPIHYGLTPGASDLIGWKSVTITPDMAGMKIATFAAIELKTRYGQLSEKQAEFLRQVLEAGGIAGVARSAEEAKTLLQ